MDKTETGTPLLSGHDDISLCKIISIKMVQDCHITVQSLPAAYSHEDEQGSLYRHLILTPQIK